jgi:Acetoacetate decarboxylase (ADC)
MKRETVRATAFAMPLMNPAFPPGPYRFINREYFIIKYRTDPDALRQIVPDPLELAEPTPIAGGRELWGFPKKLAQPKLTVEIDTLVGTLNYGSIRVATGTMGYKHRTLRYRYRSQEPCSTQFPAQDHPARRRHGAYLRTGALPPRRHHREGRMDRTCCPRPVVACLGPRRRVAGSSSAIGQARRCRPDPRARHRGPRLPVAKPVRPKNRTEILIETSAG